MDAFTVSIICNVTSAPIRNDRFQLAARLFTAAAAAIHHQLQVSIQ